MSRNLREYAAQTNRQLIIGVLVILFVFGLGLIWWLYGGKAAVFGFVCLLGALIPIGLILFFIFGIDIILKRGKRN